MKTALKLSLFVLFILFLGSCKKPKGGGDNTAQEENLVVTLNPDPGSATAPVRAAGPTYQFNVVIGSTMPTQGVNVKVEYKKDMDNTLLFSQEYNSTTSPITVTINNIPLNEIGTVTVVVTSKSKPSNTVTKTFKLVRK